MSQINMGSQGDGFSRLVWGLLSKNRKSLISILLLLIGFLSIMTFQHIAKLNFELKKLQKYKPMPVIAVARDLNIGDIIKASDLRSMMIYEKEFENILFRDKLSGLDKPALFKFNENQEDLIGRVVKLPLAKNSMLRQEYLADKGTLPGLINLLNEKHSLIDIEVPKTGFNVFIKPNDQVDLLEQTKLGSKVIASKVKVILVDSMALGAAPMQVNSEPRKTRQLTLSIPEENFSLVAKAKKEKSLMLTYKNKEAEGIYLTKNIYKNSPMKKEMEAFLPLTIIHGDKKEVLKT